MKALFAALPEDSWPLGLISGLWMGEGREAETRLAGDRRVGTGTLLKDILVVVATGSTLDSDHIQTLIEEYREANLPVMGIDASHLYQLGGKPKRGAPTSRLYDRLYRWNLDSGDSDIWEWMEELVPQSDSS